MVDVYETNYEFYGSKYVLCILIPDHIDKEIDNWQSKLDKLVLDTQLATGSFHGKFPIDDDIRSMLEELLKNGIVQPYFGATSAKACVYKIQFTPPKCIISALHEAIGENVSFEDFVTITQAEASEVAVAHKGKFMLMFNEKVFQNLRAWEHWREEDKFTSRYIYTFLPSTVGLGIVVMDTKSNEQIDISDYSDW